SLVSAIAFSADRRFLLTTEFHQNAALLWSADTGKEIRRFEGHNGPITCLAFLPDGKSIVTGSSDKTIRVWNVQTGEEVLRLTETMPVGSISVSPGGDLIAAAAEGAPGGYKSAHLWDRHSGTLIRSFEGHSNTVRAVAFSPDGKWLATGSVDQTAR